MEYKKDQTFFSISIHTDDIFSYDLNVKMILFIFDSHRSCCIKVMPTIAVKKHIFRVNFALPIINFCSNNNLFLLHN